MRAEMSRLCVRNEYRKWLSGPLSPGAILVSCFWQQCSSSSHWPDGWEAEARFAT
jgi:hypothetical protein